MGFFFFFNDGNKGLAVCVRPIMQSLNNQIVHKVSCRNKERGHPDQRREWKQREVFIFIKSSFCIIMSGHRTYLGH